MKEAKFIGRLMPSHPDFQPIIQEVREKYQLPEVDPDGEPITEIYLGDEIICLDDFHQEIRTLVEQNANYLPESLAKIYSQGKVYIDKPVEENPEYKLLPESLKRDVAALYKMAQDMARPLFQLANTHYERITKMLYVYLLMGETEEIPADWLSQVYPANVLGQTVIMATASQASDPEVIVQQFRDLYKKKFGEHQPKVTKMMVSTAYYMQLQRMGKKWDFIVEEFIRRNKFSLPRDRASKRYFDVRRRYDQMLRKRIQRAEKVLRLLLEDKK